MCIRHRHVRHPGTGAMHRDHSYDRAATDERRRSRGSYSPAPSLECSVMSIAARRVLIILAVVLLALPLLVIAGGILLLQSESTERWAEARIGDAIEREVEVEGIDFQFGWPPAI